MGWDWQRGQISLKEVDLSVERDSKQTGSRSGIIEMMNDLLGKTEASKPI